MLLCWIDVCSQNKIEAHTNECDVLMMVVVGVWAALEGSGR